ncbi:MAG: PEGA domain-containing protein [Lachnospiraceae bacterium]|nr:PEGA domain-containing protein [Lachnospiraceae bacterium]
MENQRRTGKGKYSGAIALMCTLAVLMIFSVILLFLPEQGGPGGNKLTPTSGPTTADDNPGTAKETLYTAVLLGHDKENKYLTVYDVADCQKKNLVYSGGSTFFDGYGVQVTAGQLEKGGLYLFTVNTKDEVITNGKEAIERTEQTTGSGIWEKTGVDSLVIASDKISFRNQNYRYNEALCVMSNGKQISLADINTKTDIVTVRGKDSEIYEIVVTKGHGTIALKNHEDFIGGTITIGSSKIDTVTEAGTYIVREGTYTVSVVNGEYSGTEQLVVDRDQAVEFDLFQYGRGPIQVCNLTFTVDPLGATLYIDGVKTAYTDGVQLDYGTYKIEFAEGGYDSYTTTLHVDEPTMHLAVYLKEREPTPTEKPTPSPEPTKTPQETLAPEPTEVPDISETPTVPPTMTPTAVPTETPGSTEPSGQMSVSIRDFEKYTLNLEYAIYITEPEGAEVYLDGVYIGIVPIDFEKIIGPYELLIKKKDGTLKRYQCEGMDDDTDSWFVFP